MRLNALETEKQILALQRAQALETTGIQLNRNIEDVQNQIAFPLGGFEADQLELRIKQTRRYEDAMKPCKSTS